MQVRILPALLTAAAVLLGLTIGSTAIAQEESGTPLEDRDYGDELKRIPPKGPEEALETFEVKAPFELRQVAAEPKVADPISIAFDAQSRAYVVEMIGYSEREEAHVGRVRRLSDTDGDGRMDKSTIYADGLSWPTAVICYDGGIFVGAAPDIFYFKDTDGDGRADLREKVFTGFGKSNVQGLLNSFRWGLDHRIHGASSGAGGEVRPAGDPNADPLPLRNRDFAFDPRTGDMIATSGGGQHGISFDQWGRKFVCSNSDHLQMVMFEQRYIRRNSHLPAPDPSQTIAADGPQAPVYRISPVEPWRIIRTKLRVAGKVPGPIEGGGTPAGYFTGSTGVTIYKGDAWPKKWQGLALIGDVGSNLIHRKRLKPKGVGFKGYRIDEKSEFVASEDIWFRPVQFANAPDGSLYVLDMYREVIEHPKSLPPVIKKHLDLNRGNDRGRIYRIVPHDFEARKVPNLKAMASHQLVGLLDHPNAWHRKTAARLLYERQDNKAVQPLRNRLNNASARPVGRMRALWSLDGLGALAAKDVMSGLEDPDPRVQEHAIRLAERLNKLSSALKSQLFDLATSDDIRVRYQLAFTLGELQDTKRYNALATILKQSPGDRWIRLAALSSLSQGAGHVLVKLARDGAFTESAYATSLLQELAHQVAAHERPDELDITVKALERAGLERPDVSRALLIGLGGDQAGSVRDRLAALDAKQAVSLFDQLIRKAKQIAANDDTTDRKRADAIRLLELSSFESARATLEPLLDIRRPLSVQEAALDALTGFSHPDVGSLLIGSWKRLSPTLKQAAIDALLRRPERVKLLLDALESGSVSPSNLTQDQVNRLMEQTEDEARTRAKALLKTRQAGRREPVIAKYRNAIADLEGNTKQGKQVFATHCATCHRLEGLGTQVGPNLAAFAQRGSDAILVNTLAPNREVNPQYINYLVQLKDGRTLTGMIKAESTTSLTLDHGAGTEVMVLRRDIASIESTGRSLMPAGFETAISPQQMKDLIAYLRSM